MHKIGFGLTVWTKLKLHAWTVFVALFLIWIKVKCNEAMKYEILEKKIDKIIYIFYVFIQIQRLPYRCPL